MATGQSIINVDGNKTVDVAGVLYKITVPQLPANNTMRINGVAVVAGQEYEIAQDAVITFEVVPVESGVTLTLDTTNITSASLDGSPLTVEASMQLDLPAGEHNLTVQGGESIPQVQINGTGLQNASVNGVTITDAELPYTFTPQAGITNTIFFEGAVTDIYPVTVARVPGGKLTDNNVDVTLPYTFTPTDHAHILAFTPEVYNVDLESLGGAKIIVDGVQVSDGTGEYNNVLPINKNTRIQIDGEHEVQFTGNRVSRVTIDGVVVISDQQGAFTAEYKNRSMSLTCDIQGYKAIELSGNFTNMKEMYLNGVPMEQTSEGTYIFTLPVANDDILLSGSGSQRRAYDLIFDNSGSTSISLNGQTVQNGLRYPITGDSYIEALFNGLPLNFEINGGSEVLVNGRPVDNGSSVTVYEESFVHVDKETTVLTVNYPNRTIQFNGWPSGTNQIWAPQVDGMNFHFWTTDTPLVTFTNASLINTQVRIPTGISAVTITAHYSPCKHLDIPETWQ